MGPKRNPKIEGLVGKYLETRNAFKDAARPFSSAKELLQAAMKEARLHTYESEYGTVKLSSKEKLSVEAKKGETIEA